MVWSSDNTVSKVQVPSPKSFQVLTLDLTFGLDFGLDFGLNFGLGLGLSLDNYGTKLSVEASLLFC